MDLTSHVWGGEWFNISMCKSVALPACLQYLVWLSCEEITATKCLQKLLIGPWHRLGGIFAHSSVKNSFYSGMSVDFLTRTAAFLHHFLWIKVRTVTQPYKALLLSNYSWYNNLCAPCRHLDAWPTFSWDSVHRQISWPFAFRISRKNTEFIALMESRSGTVPSHDGHYGAKQRFPSSRSKLV